MSFVNCLRWAFGLKIKTKNTQPPTTNSSANSPSNSNHSNNNENSGTSDVSNTSDLVSTPNSKTKDPSQSNKGEAKQKSTHQKDNARKKSTSISDEHINQTEILHQKDLCKALHKNSIFSKSNISITSKATKDAELSQTHTTACAA